APPEMMRPITPSDDDRSDGRRRPGEAPPSFSRWFARRACAFDPLLLLLELATLNAFYRSRQMALRMCTPALAPLQQLPLDPAAHRADALLAAFPCGASYAGQLFYVLRSGAAFDPRVALRLTDWGNAGYTAGQLLKLALALVAPRVYERARHGLFVAAATATVLGSTASALWTPDALLPLVAVASASAGRHGLGSLVAWKAATTFQVPSHIQFPVGLALWVLLMTGTAALDRRLRSPSDPPAQQPPGLGYPHAALQYIVVAMLPYIVVRIREHVWLRPQYRAYLMSRAGGGEDRSHAPMEPMEPMAACHCGLQPQQPQQRSKPYTEAEAAAAAAAGEERPAPAARRIAVGVAEPPAAPNSDSTGLNARPPALPPARHPVLYRTPAPGQGGRGGGWGTLVLSVKVPLPPPPTPMIAADRTEARRQQFQAAAEVVLRAAATAFRPHLYDGAAGGGARALGEGEGGSGSGAGGGGGGAAAAAAASEPGADGGALSSPRRRWMYPTAAVCVEGCVHLLVVVRYVEEEEGGGEAGEEGEAGPDAPVALYHTWLQQAGPGAAGGVDSPAVTAAVQRLLSEAVAGARGGATPNRPLPFVGRPLAWPPAVPLRKGLGAAAAEGEGEGDASADVLVLLPAALLRGLSGVRCAVAGPTGQPQGRQAVHLDARSEEGAGGWLARAQDEPDRGYAALRRVVSLPAAALQAAGALTLLVLPGAAAAELAPSGAVMAPGAAAGPGGAAPLAVLPLLVLPGDAALEIRQLLGRVMGEELAASLDESLVAEEDGVSGRLLQPAIGLLAGGGGRGAEAHAAAAAAVAAVGAIEAVGLSGLLYDIGDLLQLPYEFPLAAAPPAPAAADEDRGGAAAAAAAAGAWDRPQPSDPRVRSGRHLLRFLGQQRMDACLREGLHALRRAGVEEAGGWDSEGGEADVFAEDGEEASEAGDKPSGGAPPPMLLAPTGPLWWLHVLLRGFSPPPLERSYQAFKAAYCRSLDCTALVLLAAVRLSGTVQTLRAVHAEGGGGAAPPRAVQGVGAGRLTVLQQQLLTESVYAASALAPAALAVCTDLLRRRRTMLLLLRAMSDALVTLAIAPWLHRFLPVLLTTSSVWVESCRLHGLHWLYNSMLEPATLQLSPRQQLLVALINLLPMTLLGHHVNYNRWSPALVFGAANALCGIAIAAATDLPARRRFVRHHMQRIGDGGGGGLEAQQGSGAGGGGGVGPRDQGPVKEGA
ncbi:hypothetical protein TSOC_007150, partial [Tetrabaena socialis]